MHESFSYYALWQGNYLYSTCIESHVHDPRIFQFNSLPIKIHQNLLVIVIICGSRAIESY